MMFAKKMDTRLPHSSRIAELFLREFHLTNWLSSELNFFMFLVKTFLRFCQPLTSECQLKKTNN